MSSKTSKEHEKIEITVTADDTESVPLNINNDHQEGKKKSDNKLKFPTESKQTLQPPKGPDQINPRYEILHVEEKHGSLHKAIPVMPLPLAIFCCVLNIGIPGLGTLISSFTVFCGSSSRIDNRTRAFLLNLLAGFLQMITFIIIVGWIWSILWGMTFVQLRLSERDDPSSPGLPYYVRRQSSVDYRTSD